MESNTTPLLTTSKSKRQIERPKDSDTATTVE